MITRLDGVLKRELDVHGATYTLSLSPTGFALVPKGRRKGFELSWEAIVNGDAALATALNASLARAPDVDSAAKGTAGKGRSGKGRLSKR